MSDKIARTFGRMSQPGRLYACYELRMGFDSEAKVVTAYVALHREEPAEVLWAKPGFWLAGPVPEPATLVGVEQRPNRQFGSEGVGAVTEPAVHAPGASQPEIETTPRAVEQLGLF